MTVAEHIVDAVLDSLDPEEFMRYFYDPKEIAKEAVSLAVEAAELVLPIFELEFPEDKRPREAIEAAKRWILDPSKKNSAAADTAASGAADAAWAAAHAYAAAAAAADAANAAASDTAAYAVNAAGSAADAADVAADDPNLTAQIERIKGEIEALKSRIV